MPSTNSRLQRKQTPLSEIAAYVRGEYQPDDDTKTLWISSGWMQENGKITEQGLVESGLPLRSTFWLRLGADVKIHSHTLPKDLRLPIVWADKSHKDRRNWYWVVALPSGEHVIDVPIVYSPRHEVLEIKLPLDSIEKRE